MNAWRAAGMFTLSVAIAAAVLSSWARGRFEWGTPEVPKAQCEALDATSLPPAMQRALTVRYHERVGSAIVREPQNTWSNLAFVLAGAAVASHDRRFFARLLGAASIALGIASGVYHASLLPSLRTVDVSTMGWVSFALCCCGFVGVCQPSVRGQLRPWHEASIGLVGSAVSILAAVFRNDVRIGGVKPFDSTYATVAGIGAIFALIAIGLARTLRAQENRRPLFIQVGILAGVVTAAAFCQINDRPGHCFCSPESAIQGHAAWHVLMALALLLAYDLFAKIEGRSSIFKGAT